MGYVVIVEPNEMAAKKLSDLIGASECNFTYEIVANPSRAVELLEEKKVDVLISEVKMPIISGRELFSMCEMMSPDTIRIAMTDAKNISDTVSFMNECKTYKIIIEPFRLSVDVVDPILAALEYKELKERMKQEEDEVNDSIFETEEDYRRMNRSFKEQGMQYDLYYEILQKMIDKNMEKASFDPECSMKLQKWYERLFYAYQKYLVESNGKYIVVKNDLLNEFMDEVNGKSFKLGKKEDFEIEPEKMNEIAYMTINMASACKELLPKYSIKVILEKTDKYYIIRFECDYSASMDSEGVILFRESNEEYRRQLIEVSRQFVNLFSYRIVNKEKDGKNYINIAVPY